MKKILLSLLLSLSLQADYIKETIGVCSEKEKLMELKEYTKEHLLQKGGLELEIWLISHNCKVLDKKVKIEVLDYTGKKEEILKVLLSKTKEVVYAHSTGIQIEQPGQKDIIYKF